MTVSSRTQEKLEKLARHQCRSCIYQPDPFRTCGYLSVREALDKKCSMHKGRMKNV